MAADERWAHGWPDFAETWFGETLTYPTGRGLTRPATGWVCSGCQRGFSPSMRECPYCPETGAMTMPEAGAGCLPGCCDGDDS